MQEHILVPPSQSLNWPVAVIGQLVHLFFVRSRQGCRPSLSDGSFSGSGHLDGSGAVGEEVVTVSAELGDGVVSAELGDGVGVAAGASDMLERSGRFKRADCAALNSSSLP